MLTTINRKQLLFTNFAYQSKGFDGLEAFSGCGLLVLYDAAFRMCRTATTMDETMN